jgi:hypothetical protein
MLRLIIAGMLISTAAAAQTTATTSAPPTEVTELMSRDLQGLPGKEGTMLLVEYPPGGADPCIATMRPPSSMCLRAPW